MSGHISTSLTIHRNVNTDLRYFIVTMDNLLPPKRKSKSSEKEDRESCMLTWSQWRTFTWRRNIIKISLRNRWVPVLPDFNGFPAYQAMCSIDISPPSVFVYSSVWFGSVRMTASSWMCNIIQDGTWELFVQRQPYNISTNSEYCMLGNYEIVL